MLCTMSMPSRPHLARCLLWMSLASCSSLIVQSADSITAPRGAALFAEKVGVLSSPFDHSPRAQHLARCCNVHARHCIAALHNHDSGGPFSCNVGFTVCITPGAPLHEYTCSIGCDLVACPDVELGAAKRPLDLHAWMLRLLSPHSTIQRTHACKA
jgi:hypothetical protein